MCILIKKKEKQMSNDNFSRVITLFLANVTIANIAIRLSISETAVEEVIREVLIDELLSVEPRDITA
jgi:hypothetical protein